MKPLVSIVLPTDKRPELLNRCLEALMRQSLPYHTFEVIVVDDADDSATRQVVEAAAQRSKTTPIVYLAQPQRRGPVAARNRGWREAKGSIIGFTNDDCIPGDDWIRNAVDAFIDGAEVVSGHLCLQCSEKTMQFQRISSYMENAELVTANCFCLKTALEKVDGLEESFDTAWQADNDLQFKFIKSEIPITKRKDVVTDYPIRPGSWWECLKEERNNCYDALLYKRHPKLFREKLREQNNALLYYTIVIGFLIGVYGQINELTYVSFYGFALFTAFLVVLFIKRLWGTPLNLVVLGQTVVTTAATPFLAVYWRLHGAVKHRTLYW
ncbi:glycosyltransferase [Tellurirhabdus bombi]|uniref:glycosyltransferase n=1 Tax=Tellurirhabdus bombi TaxID=2907205 RepID=UPI001F1D1968|nr:glycosyltransferase family 2 protein [Tellurirhabdus bombi]